LAIFLDFSLVGGILVWTWGERRGLDALPYLATVLGYMFLCTALFGSTLGKRLVRLRVVGIDGRPVGWRRALVRELLARCVSMFLTFGLAYLIAAIRADGRSLDDLVAGTIVQRSG
jgi:uncharacterized RDD family membrane protein YckC